MTTALWLALFLTFLQVWDGWTTYKVLRYPSGGEKNKLIRRLIAFLQRYVSERKAEYAALLLAKGGAAALAWLLALMPIPHPAGEDIRLGLLLALAVLYVLIAAMNYNVLCKLRERK